MKHNDNNNGNNDNDNEAKGQLRASWEDGRAI